MILCVGEAVIDMFQKTVPGPGDVFMPIPGGCSYNTSIAIGRLDVPAAFLGRLSKNFFGEIQVNRLKENNVNCDFLIRSDQNSILAIIKTEENKQPQYAFYNEGTSDSFLSVDDLPAQLPDDVTCIVFGSISMNMEPIASTIETFILREAANKKVISFDPNIRPFMIKDRDSYVKHFNKWAEVSTIAKVSSEDFEFIYPGTEPENALRKMLDSGTRLAIATLGEEGAIALLRRYDGNITKVKAPGVHIPAIADTVGAGDTFHGAFLAFLDQRNKLSHNEIACLSETDLYDALFFANKAAAIVCTRHGAEPPTLAEMNNLCVK